MRIKGCRVQRGGVLLQLYWLKRVREEVSASQHNLTRHSLDGKIFEKDVGRECIAALDGIRVLAVGGIFQVRLHVQQISWIDNLEIVNVNVLS